MNSLSWHLLRDGAGAGPILTVDHGDGRQEAGFPELVPHLTGVGTCLVTRFHDTRVAELVRAGTGHPERIRAEIADWGDELVRAGWRPPAILSFCAGARLALALAGNLADRGVHAPVIMLDPVLIEPEFLLDRFERAVHGLSTVLESEFVEETLAEAAAAVRRTPGRDGCDVAGHAEHLAGRYHRTARRACARADLPAEVADEMHAHFAAVLQYQTLTALVPTDDLRLAAPDPGRTVLISRDHRIRPPLPRASRVFDVDRPAFLADRGLATAVAEIIRGYAADC